MKKLFLVFVLLFGASLAFGKDAPIDIRFVRKNNNVNYIEIKSLYNGSLTVDLSKSTVNDGECMLIDYEKVYAALASTLLSMFTGNDAFDEVTNEGVRQIPDQRVVRLDFGETVGFNTVECAVENIKIVTSRGTFKFNLR
ncbi:hypothetical protein [Campylobacter showae]|jgi:hypothetical protein|uniref:hypothetical protein n=1 Tax=Campylobacter showae TaxID=204 RepID=UPI000F096C9B|nr:hypothetical protein [Campylobacter showae]